MVPVRPATRPSSSPAAARGSRLTATDGGPASATAHGQRVHGDRVHRDRTMRDRAVYDRSVHDLAPLCVVGDRILTELVDVTDDLGALDSSGLWALVLPYSG